ncbi:RE1-silencing transcription factor B-like [Branchiostoma floridae]|uniref:RE1-silencing transcription factor B-like n=1 Tax=Branchiostoma floridae TaxID=7739 RepID=C3ZKH7_BRAFL|nr:RE1-silencing transcription factor B-like [Branchiostoma floridae]XP_035674742.1 RE1-silencing transcription factor B-like [Branchiostoma floridae]|eukprot:XP_002591065.1 hypothetical protein BRAFLDRAFT_69380 [Branchiostoma floridae]
MASAGKEISTRKCPLCKFTTADQQQLESHMFTHIKANLIVCDKCGYRALNHGAMTKHMRTHTGERPPRACKPRMDTLKCPLCKFAATNRKEFESHMFTHACFRSMWKTTMEKQVKTHIGEEPFVQVASSEPSTEMSRHSCHLCKYTTTDQKELESHRAVHVTYTGEPFMCGECMYRTDSMYSLQMHMNTHLKEIATVCEPACEQSQNNSSTNIEPNQENMAANSNSCWDNIATNNEAIHNKMATNIEPLSQH